MGKSRSWSQGLVALAMFVLFAASIAFASPSYAYQGELASSSTALKTQVSGANLDAAKAVFKVADEEVYEATSVDNMLALLKRAGAAASASKPCIVHVPAGSYSVERLNIPANVIFVAEDAAKFMCTDAGQNSMVFLDGSLYGGSYDGAYKAINVLYFGKKSFSGVNGIVQKAVVKCASKQGVLAMDSACKNAQIINCTVTNCRENGICILKDSNMKQISGCMTSNNSFSGINISHSNVGTIKNCTIANNGDKAISTNSDPLAGYKQPGCAIGAITGCTIKGNKMHGVYLKPKCCVDEFTNNTLINNKDGLVCAGSTAAGTKGTSYAKNVHNNKFQNNANGNIAAEWKGATVYVGNNNQVSKGKFGLIAKEGGCIKVTGKKNAIKAAKNANINVIDGSTLVISGTDTKVQSSSGQGIYGRKGTITISGKNLQLTGGKNMGIALYKKSKMIVTGAKFTVKNNKSTGLYVVGGSSFTSKGQQTSIQGSGSMGVIARKSTVRFSGTKGSITDSKNAGVGLYDKAKFFMTGKGSFIRKNGSFGIYANGKVTATLKKVNLSGNKSGAIYKKGGAKVTR